MSANEGHGYQTEIDAFDARKGREAASAPLGEPKCKCGDPACRLWRDDVKCAHCVAVLRSILDDEDFDGRAGDMGEGHYSDCPHGLVIPPKVVEGICALYEGDVIAPRLREILSAGAPTPPTPSGIGELLKTYGDSCRTVTKWEMVGQRYRGHPELAEANADEAAARAAVEEEYAAQKAEVARLWGELKEERRRIIALEAQIERVERQRDEAWLAEHEATATAERVVKERDGIEADYALLSDAHADACAKVATLEQERDRLKKYVGPGPRR